MTEPRLSAILVVLNEEQHLPGCLATLAFADEIIVVDSHSGDRSADICRATPRVRYLDGDFCGILDKKRFALEQARAPWVLNIDADERVTPELHAAIEAVLDHPDGAAGYEIPRRNFYMGRRIAHGEWRGDRVLRLFRREVTHYEGVDPHAHPVVAGRVDRLKAPLDHFVYRDFEHQMRTVTRYAALAARQMHAEGRRFRWRDALMRPPARFLKTWLLKGGFLDGLPGLAIAYSSAYYDFAKFALLAELEADSPPAPR